ncbi:MAG TPA: fumarate hydratase [candidate division WOR-3 bacterium]|uniref:Fumarate hydratase n=1 Tax=candidate division WOR-3 bacterium TaxID=2052148 RepID=A0A7C0VB02_UNCW3|nr:fumarate hydratase [candidate division WOR-3 bacterium]
MREVKFDTLVSTVRDLCMDANYYIPDDVRQKIIEFRDKEESEVARNILDIILKNHEVSANEKMPICQDTGFAVFFIEMGEDVRITGGGFEEAIYEGVRQGYREGYLRKSIVDDPLFERKNTKDNTPPIIHLRLVPGDKIKIVFAPKGGGSENMSEVKMMVPADGEEGVKRFVVDRVRRSGGNPCPPVIVGVGIGGTFEHVAYLAKKALLRPVGSHHPDPRFAKLEDEILEEINKLGIGPMGLGGRTTALAVHIETHPCHIASMPVAVNMQCHAARHKEAII